MVMHVGEILMNRLLAAFPESQALDEGGRRAEELIKEGGDYRCKCKSFGGFEIALKVEELEAGRLIPEIVDG